MPEFKVTVAVRRVITADVEISCEGDSYADAEEAAFAAIQEGLDLPAHETVSESTDIAAIACTSTTSSTWPPIEQPAVEGYRALRVERIPV